MSRWMKLAFGCHFVTALLFILFGGVYLLRPEFMPYHAIALGKDWNELETAYQILILALMRVTGGAWLGVGSVMILMLLFPFRQGQRWVYWTLPFVGVSASASALYATLLVKSYTPANPPWITAMLGVIASLLGYVASLKSIQRKI